MNTNYYIEDGHYMDIEEITQLVRFKIREIRDQNKSVNEIIEFDENEIWQKIARDIINASNIEYETDL